jgi:flagellar hook-length control protein FliK
MNQEFLLSADSVNPTINTGGKKNTVNSQLDTKNEGRQAFSSELDKHIDRQEQTDKTATSDTKQSDIKDNNQHQQKAEESENKNGNTLPDEQSLAQDVIAQSPEVLTSETQQTIEKVVVVTDEAELGSDIADSVNLLSGQPIAQSPTQELHATSIKESAANNPNPVVTTDTNKLVSVDVATLNQNKQQSETPKIRPDILQALSARLSGKDGENSPIKSDLKTLLTTEQFVDKKPVFKELQLTGLVKTMVQQAGQQADRTSNVISNAFANMPATANVTESIARPEVPSLDIQPAVQSKAWNRVLSGRVIWMAREGIQQATLKLNPANLGPVEVKLTMSDEKVHVTFVAQHAATRDALEQALPRLRESFIESGLEFADADVFQHDFEQADNSQDDKESVNAETEQSVLSEGVTDNEQQVVGTEQDIEVGVSLYA